ncbi:MAG: tRNA pseudouridine(13) synthase TruD [Candidatus Woesearchaeota archaeon]
MYKIKQQPEDFIVKEISTVKPEKEGKYSYFLLKKKNYTTIRALEHIAQALNIQLKKLGFAGNKDKTAITEQVCSAEGIGKEKLEKVKLKDIEIKFLGKGNEPVSLGTLEGNEFEITVRNIDKKPKPKTKFINFFGEQRFSKNNAEIGKAIVKKEFKQAVNLLLEGKGDVEKRIKEYLSKNPNNYVGALRTIPAKILKLYIHAYQSWIWNQTAETHKEEELAEIPLVGFGTIIADKCMADLLLKEKIEPRDFIIREIPELSSEGSSRSFTAEAKDLKIGELEEDELNKGKKKVLIKFKLQKGSYATEFIKQLFSQD